MHIRIVLLASFVVAQCYAGNPSESPQSLAKMRALVGAVSDSVYGLVIFTGYVINDIPAYIRMGIHANADESRNDYSYNCRSQGYNFSGPNLPTPSSKASDKKD